ncbi:MAG: response regulator transcription factor [Candidatus Omnitrophota bacterium]
MVNNRHITVVDDDPGILDLVYTYLTKEGFAAKGLSSGEKFFEFLKTEKPDLVILDRVLPGMNGFEICKKLKETEKFSSIPVIMLSQKGEAVDKVSGLNVGADDYMGKPFDLEELKARIEALLRRRGTGGKDKKLTVGDTISMDLQKCQVVVKKRKVELTFAEFKILELLASRRGQVFTRGRILEYLWGDEKIVVERTVDVHVRNLRKKLGKAGKLIKNIRGFGYVLEDPPL